MSRIHKPFAEAQINSVDSKLPIGGWRVYPSYEVWEYEEGGERDSYVEAANTPLVEDGKRLVPSQSTEWVYAPLHEPNLFIEFATLFGDGTVYLDEAPPVVLDWVERKGVLGGYATYPTRNGGWVSERSDERESVMRFVRLSAEANRCLQLIGAVKAPGGPDVEKLRRWNARGDTPDEFAKWAKSFVEETVSMHLENETCVRLYRRRDGTNFRGPGFHSLLGAMYLQMSNFLEAPEKDITFCRWCKEVVAFEEGDPPPSDAPKGARGKHKTHSNRDFCKEKNGVRNYCKNTFHYNLRKDRKAAKKSEKAGA